ncbi:MAG: lytic transglycosylase domain-containing protein [Thermodesulfobacteriota bacterium]
MALIILQNIFIFPLDKGQKYAYVIFRKPVSTIITIPEDLLNGELSAKSGQSLPAVPNLWLTKDEHLFHPIIVKVANEHEIDPALIKAIIMAESGYNPKAISKRGAMGLMQLMPGTAEALGIDDIFNPELNINAGVLYFKRLVDFFEGDVKLALAAYNAGINKVKMYQGIPPFKATRYYIKKVFKYYEHYRQQMTSDLKQA